ncbi:MAG: tyrosine--tRNA ligase [bacterium]|nr:tyrosine--tRNA ligase [bacterium]
MKIITDKQKIEEVLSRGVDEVLVKENLRKRLESGKKLRVKFGIDPTGSVLHLGHAVPLRKLKGFQDLGHQVIFLIGDFTAKIGDPTGRSQTRKPMTAKEIKANMKSYAKQAGLILDMKKVEIRHNSEWLDKLDFQESIMLASKITYAQMMQRADFKERIKNDQDLSLQEFLYPMMQGYDSVALKADVELGGTDQKFNLLMGRQLQKRYGQEPQDIVTCPLLEGLSGGDKMSKSLDNYIALTEKPEEMYGKIMSLTDNLIIRYFSLCTDLAVEEIGKIERELAGSQVNPRNLKMRLAFEVVKIYHGERKAVAAQEYFIKTVQKKETPDKISNIQYPISNANIVELLVETKLAESKSEAKRLIEQGGIKIDGVAIKDINASIELTEAGVLVQRGKRGFVRVIKK